MDMKVKELIEKLQEFDEDMEVFYDDDNYGPIKTDEVYETTLYEEYDGIGGYWMTKNKGGKEIKGIYIE